MWNLFCNNFVSFIHFQVFWYGFIRTSKKEKKKKLFMTKWQNDICLMWVFAQRLCILYARWTWQYAYIYAKRALVQKRTCACDLQRICAFKIFISYSVSHSFRVSFIFLRLWKNKTLYIQMYIVVVISF